VDLVNRIDPKRLKFGDEKLLKGREIFARSSRRDILTGEVPCVPTPGNFRNAYCITGIIAIDSKQKCATWVIQEETNDSFMFSLAIENAIATGFLKGGDVLVLDNAAIHQGGENRNLGDWLWDFHGVYLLLLPARAPELNPIELLWNTLVKRMQQYSNDKIASLGPDGCAHAADFVLSNFSRSDIKKMYRHCGYLE